VIESLVVPASLPPRVRLGIVGGGLIAQVAHLPVLARLDRSFRVGALADPSARVRAALQARWAIPQAFPDHRGLLEHGSLDAVLVCSPHATHASVARDALHAGLHVLVEKPLCLAPADADAIASGAREGGRVVQVGYMKRFDPGYELMLADPPRPRRIETTTIDPGIGTTLRPADFIAPDDVPDAVGAAVVEATASQVAEATGSDDRAHVRAYADAFLGALIHDVNAVLGLLDATGMTVERVIDAAGAEDGSLASCELELSGGVRWSAAWMLAPGAREFTQEIRLLTGSGARTLTFPAPYVDPVTTYARELEHFHACVRGRTECRTPAEQGARDVHLLAHAFRTSLDRDAAVAS
jgi:predicted dehydrogenase